MLTLRCIDIMTLSIPMRLTFRHALATRDTTDSIVVRVDDGEGHVGFGEGAPRSYVTGESSETAVEALQQRLAPRILGATLGSYDDAVAQLGRLLDGLPRNEHAAMCALDLAVLDIAGHVFGCSAGTVVGPIEHERVRYSGVVSGDGVDAALKACEMIHGYGIAAVKLKVGTDPDDDLRILAGARSILGDECSLRIDANGAWTAPEALQRLEAFAPFGLEAVEQPVARDDLDGLTWLTERSPTPVIVDESLASRADAEMLIDRRACHCFNIRVSKCGGLVNAARIREMARQAGITCMLGAQVGETALLSAAGRHFATRSKNLLFIEGSYDKIVLEENIGEQDLTIGPGGWGPVLTGNGLGVDVDEARLSRFVDHRVRIGGP